MNVTPAVEVKQSVVNPLVSKFFHSIREDKKTINWQGIVESEVSTGLLLVQLFSWVTGDDTDQVLVPVADMAHWKFYNSSEDMNEAWRKRSRRDR